MSISGTLKVSNDCIADLAGYAALECYGVVGMAEIDETQGVAHLLPQGRLRKGIDVVSGENNLHVHLHIIIEQGINISSLVHNLESSVKFILSHIAELENVDVTVHVEGMRASR